MERIKAFIFDLDGVLQDPKSRIQFWKNKQYEKFNSIADLDDPIKDTVALCKILLNANYFIIFLTGRTEDYKNDTIVWLENNLNIHEGNQNIQLIMRPINNIYSDAQFKKTAYEQLIEPFYDIAGVFEDRVKVVNMWRELQVTCYALPDLFNRENYEKCNCCEENSNFNIPEKNCEVKKSKEKISQTVSYAINLRTIEISDLEYQVIKTMRGNK